MRGCYWEFSVLLSTFFKQRDVSTFNLTHLDNILHHTHTHTHTQSPRGKLRCIVKSCKVLISLLQYAKCGDPPGADDLFPVLVYVLIKSNPPGLLSTIQFINHFVENQLLGEDAYWWAQFSTAVEFSKTLV